MMALWWIDRHAASMDGKVYIITLEHDIWHLSSIKCSTFVLPLEMPGVDTWSWCNGSYRQTFRLSHLSISRFWTLEAGKGVERVAQQQRVGVLCGCEFWHLLTHRVGVYILCSREGIWTSAACEERLGAWWSFTWRPPCTNQPHHNKWCSYLFKSPLLPMVPPSLRHRPKLIWMTPHSFSLYLILSFAFTVSHCNVLEV